ncbi:hypothetical protein B0H11DRAFT_1938327 [Mycena galericulata]|nr:hypothetical protein B0H11DRAFT_1938327 [Mycena galericulata]
MSSRVGLGPRSSKDDQVTVPWYEMRKLMKKIRCSACGSRDGTGSSRMRGRGAVPFRRVCAPTGVKIPSRSHAGSGSALSSRSTRARQAKCFHAIVLSSTKAKSSEANLLAPPARWETRSPELERETARSLSTEALASAKAVACDGKTEMRMRGERERDGNAGIERRAKGDGRSSSAPRFQASLIGSHLTFPARGMPESLTVASNSITGLPRPPHLTDFALATLERETWVMVELAWERRPFPIAGEDRVSVLSVTSERTNNAK